MGIKGKRSSRRLFAGGGEAEVKKVRSMRRSEGAERGISNGEKTNYSYKAFTGRKRGGEMVALAADTGNRCKPTSSWTNSSPRKGVLELEQKKSTEGKSSIKNSEEKDS